MRSRILSPRGVPYDLDPAVQESASLAIDPRYAAEPSSPYGDAGVSYLPVPAPPSDTAALAYFGVLHSVPVPRGRRARLVGIRQAVMIGLRVQPPDAEETGYDLDVTSPFWRLPDGFVTFWLRWIPGGGGRERPTSQALPENFSDQIRHTSTAWLAASVTPSYVPLNGGLPPGQPVAGLSVLHDLRFPWTLPAGIHTHNLALVGPGRIALYVTVKQTDPLRPRGTAPVPTPVPGRPEDAFVANNPGLVRYTGVAGSLLVHQET